MTVQASIQMCCIWFKGLAVEGCNFYCREREHYKKYTPCQGINRVSSLFIGISYGADPKL